MHKLKCHKTVKLSSLKHTSQQFLAGTEAQFGADLLRWEVLQQQLNDLLGIFIDEIITFLAHMRWEQIANFLQSFDDRRLSGNVQKKDVGEKLKDWRKRNRRTCQAKPQFCCPESSPQSGGRLAGRCRIAASVQATWLHEEMTIAITRVI